MVRLLEELGGRTIGERVLAELASLREDERIVLRGVTVLVVGRAEARLALLRERAAS